MLFGNRFLNAARLRMIFTTLADTLEVRRPLIFLKRVPWVDADDDEIVGTFTGRYFAADLIANDQEAVIYEGGYFELSATQIPNIKYGQKFTQGMIQRLARLQANQASAADVAGLDNWEMQTARNLLLGVRMRINQLICAMMLDSVVYDRLGVKISGSFGMPSALKGVSVIPWTSHATATPITDLQTMRLDVGAEQFGVDYNRYTMSTPTLLEMVSCTQFQQLLAGWARTYLPVGSFDPRDPQLRQAAEAVLGATIETYDGHIQVRTAAGGTTNQRVLPHGVVLIDSTANDGDGSVMDWANGAVTEATVAGLVGKNDAFFGPSGPDVRGPLAYYTAPEDLNPPNLFAWGVARGFPRKHNKYATATLTCIPQPAALTPA